MVNYFKPGFKHHDTSMELLKISRLFLRFSASKVREFDLQTL